MAKEPHAKPSETADSENTLESALAYYAERENCDLIEGVLRPDRNNPPAADFPGNVIIAVSSNEFYSVSATDILPPEGAPAGHPQRVWIRRGAQVWHCRQTPLKIQHEAPLKAKDFSGLFDKHISSHLDQFRTAATLAAAPTPTIARAPARTVNCILKAYHRQERDLDVALQTIFGENDAQNQLYLGWPGKCFGYNRPKRPCYNKWFDSHGVTTLRGFIDAFFGGVRCL